MRELFVFKNAAGLYLKDYELIDGITPSDAEYTGDITEANLFTKNGIQENIVHWENLTPIPIVIAEEENMKANFKTIKNITCDKITKYIEDNHLFEELYASGEKKQLFREINNIKGDK